MATAIDKLTPQQAIQNLRTSGEIDQDQADSAMRSFESIKSSDLRSEPDFKLTPPAPPTQAPALQGQIETVADQFTTDLEKQTQQADSQKTDAEQQYLSSILGTEGEIESTAREYSRKGGVDDTQAELIDINQQIRQEQNALRRQIERVQTTPGLTKGQVDQRTGEMERVSLRKQADLSVISMAINARYETAKAIADRSVAVQLEQQRTINEALRIQYEDNKDLFNKSESRLFETQLADRNRNLDAEEKRLQEVSDLSLNALENGAPTSVALQMRQAKTPEDAIKIGGQYINAYDRQMQELQMLNIRDQIADRNKPDVDGGGTDKPLTASQFAALGYGERLLQSSLVIDEIGGQFIGQGSAIASYLPNTLKGSERQRFEQAQRNFVNSVLRRESGAAISPEEFESAKIQYFPQPGDKTDVLIQKKANRDLVIKNMLKEGGVDTTPQDASLADPLQIGVTSINSNPLEI